MLVLSSGSGLDIAGELGAVLGPGFEVSLVRAANRQTVELVLDGAVQFGIVHILAHGATSVLDFGDERMSEAELVSLISAQKALQFVVLACCNGYETAGGIHNELHVPVVAYNAPIEDRAAVEFARGFYRSWRRDRDVGQAVDRGREALAVLYPTEAPKVRLLNGDMVTPAAFGACMGKIDERLDRHGGAVGRDQSAVGSDGRLSAALVVRRAAAGRLADRGAGGDAISERGADSHRTVVEIGENDVPGRRVFSGAERRRKEGRDGVGTASVIGQGRWQALPRSLSPDHLTLTLACLAPPSTAAPRQLDSSRRRPTSQR